MCRASLYSAWEIGLHGTALKRLTCDSDKRTNVDLVDGDTQCNDNDDGDSDADATAGIYI